MPSSCLDSTLLGPGFKRVDSELRALVSLGLVKCPICQSSTDCRRFRRSGIYPVPAAMLYLGYFFAVLWLAGRPWLWQCGSCGAIFKKHSAISLTWRVLAWAILGAGVIFVLGTIASAAAFVALRSLR